MFEQHHFDRLLTEIEVLRHDVHHLRHIIMASITDLNTNLATLGTQISALAARIPSVTGTPFTITDNITGGGSAQTVTVSDSTGIIVGSIVTVDTGSAQEGVTVTAVPDSTHITGVFVDNHTAPVTAFSASSTPGTGAQLVTQVQLDAANQNVLNAISAVEAIGATPGLPTAPITAPTT